MDMDALTAILKSIHSDSLKTLSMGRIPLQDVMALNLSNLESLM